MNPSQPTSPQKFSWTIVLRTPSFEEADTHRNKLKQEGKTVKVHKMGGEELFFAVKVGEPLR